MDVQCTLKQLVAHLRAIAAMLATTTTVALVIIPECGEKPAVESVAHGSGGRWERVNWPFLLKVVATSSSTGGSRGVRGAGSDGFGYMADAAGVCLLLGQHLQGVELVDVVDGGGVQNHGAGDQGDGEHSVYINRYGSIA